jgi:predicted nucleic acid-binding protein
MTRYLLDTSALIDFSKGREPASTRILEMIDSGDEVGVCAINVAEFYAGLPPETRPIWDAFFTALTYWPISRQAAMRAGQYRHAFARKGRTLTTTDALVAAVAQEYQAVVVTDNLKDYPMAEVRLLPLRQEDEPS